MIDLLFPECFGVALARGDHVPGFIAGARIGTVAQLGVAAVGVHQRRAHALLDGDDFADEDQVIAAGKALEIAGSIEIPALKARALGAIASSAGKNDPEFAKGVLSRCSSMLSDIKDPADRMDTWATVAQAAWNIKDEKQAWEAIDRGIADAMALYKLDTDEDSPNVALREYWPSTQAQTGSTAPESCATARAIHAAAADGA